MTALTIDDDDISTEEATETVRAIRYGKVDAVVVNANGGEAVFTFHAPDPVYRSLVEAMDEGAALVTSDGIITYHNPRFATLTSESGGPSLCGRALTELVASDARVSIESMLQRAADGPARIEVGLLRIDGVSVPVQLTGSAISVMGIPMLCVVATDLREQREQLELYRKALIGMTARDRLISIAGHELRAPLQALVFDIGVVLARQKPAEAATTELEAIQLQAIQLAAMVGKLLDVRLLGSDQLELTRDEVNLAEVVHAVVSQSAELVASQSPITLVVAPVWGEWDRARLVQVVTNLLSNAVKYGLGKPIRVVVEGTPRIARLVVEDHGVGIPAEAHGRLFTAFERIGSVQTAPGLGLGLFISSQIVRAHGGTIRVESDPQSGSRFIVELPRRPG